MHVNMILADNALQNMHIFRIAYLSQNVPTSDLNITFQNLKSVFGYPHYVTRQRTYGVSSFAILSHISNLPKSF